MARRARLEVRERLAERRKDLRLRRREEERIGFWRAFWRDWDDYLFRKARYTYLLFWTVWATRQEYYVSREPWFRVFARIYWARLEEHLALRAAYVMAVYALIVWAFDYYRNRAMFVYITKDEHGKWQVVAEARKDRMVLDRIPRENWPDIARALHDMVEAKGNMLITITPELYALMRRYIGMTRLEPCKHAMADIKITPFTMLDLRGRPMYGYTLRWSFKSEISDTDTVRRTAPMDLRMYGSLLRKPRHRIFKGKLPAVETENLQERVEAWLGRDGMSRPRRGLMLLDAMLRPHVMKREFTRNIGMAEAQANVGHCSIFAVPLTRARVSREMDEITLRKFAHGYATRRPVINYESFWQSKMKALPFLPDELFEFPAI